MEVPGKFKGSEEVLITKKTYKLCEPCQGDDITKQSDGFCKECEEYMCNACFSQHIRVRSCRNHVMVDRKKTVAMSRRADSVVRCKQHGETIKYFCRKHEIVGCGDCVVHSHNDCKAEFIVKLAKGFHRSNELQTLKIKMEELASLIAENKTNIGENKRNDRIVLEKTLEDISQFRTDINIYLDKVEEDVISEAKALMSDNEQLLTKVEHDCELLSTKIDSITQKLNDDLFSDNELYINTVQIRPRVSEIENEVAEIQKQKLVQFEFLPDDDLKDLVSSVKRLGRLVTTTVAITPQSTQKKEEKINDVSDQEDKEMKEADKVRVGARVKSNWGHWEGTVTKVHSAGTVDVKWDNGKTSGPFKIGRELGQVYPI